MEGEGLGGIKRSWTLQTGVPDGPNWERDRRSTVVLDVKKVEKKRVRKQDFYRSYKHYSILILLLFYSKWTCYPTITNKTVNGPKSTTSLILTTQTYLTYT